MLEKISINMLAVVVALLSWAETKACTNFLVGKNASADGSVFISYSSDDYGMFSTLARFPAANHPKGTKHPVYNWEDLKYQGEIDEAEHTYSVIGNINEFQLAIAETTFGGRDELVDKKGIIDYGSLIYIALQRSRNAREAIKTMTSLVDEYGYCSSGESFSIADKNEAWILEMVGKAGKSKGAVWVAVRIPDDCISAHANQSRIHKFALNDKKNCLYSPDVISFARSQGYFTGKDADFDFANAYCPAGFGERRYCEARVWSFFNAWTDEMTQYLNYAKGIEKGLEPMPLYVKPKVKLSARDVMTSMRDHYEGTPFDMTSDVSAGVYAAPYRPTPLSWEYNGKKYFNERPASTQQSAFTFVAQMRSSLPDAVGGILWFGNDDANTTPYTPVYCSALSVPDCYSGKDADGVTFSWNSAFWVCNWVANMVYPRYAMMFPSVEAARNGLENEYLSSQNAVEAKALALHKESKEKAVAYLDRYTTEKAQQMLAKWKELGTYLIVKYNDQAIKPEKNGKFERTPEGIGARVERPSYPEAFKKIIVEETGDRYLIPEQK